MNYHDKWMLANMDLDVLRSRIKATAEGTDCIFCGLPAVNGSEGMKHVHDCGCPWNEKIIDAAMMQHDEVMALQDTNKILLQETKDLKKERDILRRLMSQAMVREAADEVWGREFLDEILRDT